MKYMEDQNQEQTPQTEAQPTEAQNQEEKPTAKKADKFDSKLSEELSKWQKRAKEAEAKIKNTEIETAKNQQQWRELAEKFEKEYAEEKMAREKEKMTFTNFQKLAAVREYCNSLGIHKESLDDIHTRVDLNNISLEYDNEGKNFVVSGADKEAQRLKALRPNWFKSSAPNVNTTTPSVTSASKPTITDIKKAEIEAKKTGDYESLKKLYLAYNKK